MRIRKTNHLLIASALVPLLGSFTFFLLLRATGLASLVVGLTILLGRELFANLSPLARSLYKPLPAEKEQPPLVVRVTADYRSPSRLLEGERNYSEIVSL